VCGGLILGCFFKCVFKLSLRNIFFVSVFNELLKLSCGLVSVVDGIHLLYGMPRRIILRHNGSHCYDGELLIRIILCCVCNSVFNMSRCFFSSNIRLFKLLSMSRRVVLRHRGPDSSDRCVRRGKILDSFFKCVFKLSLGNIFFVCIFNYLLELSCGLVSGINGIHILYDMSWRIILCSNGSRSCHEELLFWIILCSVSYRVLKLPCWVLPINVRLFKLLGMSWRVVLRHRGPDCSNRSLRGGLILDRVFNCLFKLSLGNVFIVGIFNELL